MKRYVKQGDVLKILSFQSYNEADGELIRSIIATEWSIVYDIKNLRIHFRALENQEIRHIDIKQFDFSCKTPVKVFDIQSEQSGDVTKKFIDYSQQINQASVKNVFNNGIPG